MKEKYIPKQNDEKRYTEREKPLKRERSDSKVKKTIELISRKRL